MFQTCFSTKRMLHKETQSETNNSMPLIYPEFWLTKKEY